MQYRVVWYIGTGISEKPPTFTFTESPRLLCNVSMYLTNYSDTFQQWEYSVPMK